MRGLDTLSGKSPFEVSRARAALRWMPDVYLELRGEDGGEKRRGIHETDERCALQEEHCMMDHGVFERVPLDRLLVDPCKASS